MTTIPGIKAAHAIITPPCRLNRGDSGALAEAFARVQKEYEDIVSARSDQFVCHVALIVEDAPSVVLETKSTGGSEFPKTEIRAALEDLRNGYTEKAEQLLNGLSSIRRPSSSDQAIQREEDSSGKRGAI